MARAWHTGQLTAHARLPTKAERELGAPEHLPRPAAAVEAGHHHAADGALEDAMGMSQGIIQTGTFFQLGFIKGFPIDQHLRGLAAFDAQAINFVGKPGDPADRERNVTFG